jgi:NAD(P)-dependent dehydrogenase (short-subunit alcohol dehydrogenase family)
MLVDLRVTTEEIAGRLEALGAPAISSVACDVSDESEVAKVVAQVMTEFAGFHVIVNVAGIMIYKSLAESTADDWRRVLDVNLLGAAFFTAHALREMCAGGAIVNVASIHAQQTSSLVAPYAAAKAALVSLTRSTAIEGRDRKIRANAVLPGAVDTAMLKASPNIAAGIEKIAAEDIGSPQEIAAAVAFLASDDARFITGASLVVDGGRLARL